MVQKKLKKNQMAFTRDNPLEITPRIRFKRNGQEKVTMILEFDMSADQENEDIVEKDIKKKVGDCAIFYSNETEQGGSKIVPTLFFHADSTDAVYLHLSPIETGGVKGKGDHIQPANASKLKR